MSRDRNVELADWIRYIEDPEYLAPITYATTKDPQTAEAVTGVEVAADDLL